MTNRQRLRLILLTSAIAGGFAFAAAAGELPLPPVGTTQTPPAAPAKAENAVPTPQRAAPAKAENAPPAAERRAHRTVRADRARPPVTRVAHAPQVHRAPAPAVVIQPAPQPAPIEIASTVPAPTQACRSCGYLVLGVAY